MLPWGGYWYIINLLFDLERQAYKMKSEIKQHLTQDMIPFWKSMRDNEHGGYYGWLGYDLKLDKQAVKGCILNSRITWFLPMPIRC